MRVTKPLNNAKGSALLISLFILSAIIFILQMNSSMDQLAQNKNALKASAQESRLHMVAFFETTLGDEMSLRNSRFSINAKLKECLTGIPVPCDERESYDMVLVSPTPPLAFQGGTWPTLPSEIPILSGGLTANKIFYTPTGGRCPHTALTSATEVCPLQAIVQFKPLCGGTMSNPELSAPTGNICPGGAKGFDITIGVGKLVGSSLSYKQKTGPGGDASTFRFSSMILKN